MIYRSILAGVFISLGGIAYLTNPNIIGACLFSIGILAVIITQSRLYTGMIGFVRCNIVDWIDVFEVLVVNLVTAILLGVGYNVCAKPEVVQTANTIIYNKLQQPWYTQIFMGIICGICIYLCVRFKECNNNILIALPIVVFIMSGANHCIADTFYFGVSMYSDLSFIPYIIRVIIGNSIGSIMIHQLLDISKNNA